jgi:hypothetical protein
MGEIMTVFAGDPINAADLNALQPLSIRRGTDLSKLSNATPANDPALKITVPAGKLYQVIGHIVYSASTTGDLRGGLYGPANSWYAGGYEGQPSAATGTAGTVTTDQVGFGNGYVWGGTGVANTLWAQFVGVLYSGDGGDFGFTWSQNVSDATAPGTTVKADSFFTLIPW